MGGAAEEPSGLAGEDLMPRKYEKIRDKMIRRGKGSRAAKRDAARVYNAGRRPGQKPVTGKCRGGG